MFYIKHNSHYVNRYIKFIQSVPKDRILEYSENHHIIPKCFGGTNKKENLIRLTYREHFIAHLILTKCFYNLDKSKMIYAFNMMMKFKTKNHNRPKMFSKYYEEKRKEWFKENCSGKNNPMYGKQGPMLGKNHTEETKKKISNSQIGQLNWQYNIEKGKHPNCGKVHTEETKQKLKYAKKISLYKHPKGIENPLYKIPRDQITKIKISESCKKKEKIMCEHCKREFDPGNYKLHHGSNCKQIKILQDHLQQM